MTASLMSVPGRFEAGSLLALQLLIFGSSAIVAFVTARNTTIRKQDLRAQFELEDAHGRMERQSMQDALTGAWNRRFLDEFFDDMADQCHDDGKRLSVAIIDVDDFKGINDQFGHHIGDEILVALARSLQDRLGERGDVIRLGGDEFQVCYCDDGLDQLLDQAIRDLQNSPVAKTLSGQRAITVSAGIAHSASGAPGDRVSLYRAADNALYRAKTREAGSPPAVAEMAQTGTWKL